MAESERSGHSRSTTPKPALVGYIEPWLKDPECVRNVCIIAHVDHGKTTLTDSLLASNGIISFKQAGKLRYLDSREDEQQRGITMESSAISLLYDDRRCDSIRRYVINLIDSPGHVDFAGHVVTASRLCDGAVVLIDAVEGVCTQTMAVLRQAHREKLSLFLVINKMDRLITELKMEPQEAAVCLFKLLEQVNALQGTIDKEEHGCCFDPVHKGNVLFASATDAWGFSLEHFAQIYSRKLSIPKDDVIKGLWGSSAYFDAKARRFVHDNAANRKCAFAQLVLQSVWSVYKYESDVQRDSIVQSLNIRFSDRDLKCGDQRAISKMIMAAWLPLSTAVFHRVIDCLPDPSTATRCRLPALIDFDWNHVVRNETIGHIAKMFSVVKPPDVHSSEREVLVAMARLFSGKLSAGQSVYILGPKYDACKQDPSTFHKYTIDRLYLLMGRDMESVECVYSGNVFGMCGNGLESMILKSGTISTTLDIVPFDRSISKSIPLLLKVAVNPVHLCDLEALQHGLAKLCQADPCAETFIQDNGEQVLAVAGELHLEMCLKDLKERFTQNLEFSVSPPLVPFRETFCVGSPNRLDSLWKGLLCDVMSVDDQKGLLRVNFGFATVSLHCATDMQGLIEVSKSPKMNNAFYISPELQMPKSYESSMSTGFKVAMEAGPLCNEAVSGMSICLVGFQLDPHSGKDEAEVCGRLISDFATACHSAMMFWSPRLQLATYACDIQTTADYLGRVYGVLSKRRGKIISEEYNETTNFFTIHSHLPVIESLGFGHDLRSKTSGIAVPQLVFIGYYTFEVDPFALDPDMHDSSPNEDYTNDAMRYLVSIRERKGMFLERRIVECAEKQRTLRK